MSKEIRKSPFVISEETGLYLESYKKLQDAESAFLAVMDEVADAGPGLREDFDAWNMMASALFERMERDVMREFTSSVKARCDDKDCPYSMV
jgi:hypothetical protein